MSTYLAASPDMKPGERRTSELLLDAVKGDGERISIGDILNALDARAFGFALLLFSIPSLVPMPPGVPTVVGVVLLIVAFQMVVGRQELWLPPFLSRKSFSRQALVSGFRRVTPWLERVEKLSRPRLLFLTGRAGTIIVGIVALIMAIVLILPLPFGANFPPAAACAILGIGLVERDGLIILLGAIASAAAIVAAYVLTRGFIAFLPKITGWFAGIFGF